MNLYHIHLLGNNDNLYKEGQELIINENAFNNRLYNRTYRSNLAVSKNNYYNSFQIANNFNAMMGFIPLGEYTNLSEILPIIIQFGTSEEKIQALNDAKTILYNAAFAKRELSIEQYRKDFEPNKPSRLHSLYACEENAVSYWVSTLSEGPADIYRLEIYEEPFITNEQLLPLEISSYEESYNAAKRYFNPRQKDLNGITDELLIRGKVKLLEKVEEIRTY